MLVWRLVSSMVVVAMVVVVVRSVSLLGLQVRSVE
jgi:hypothetical protein